MRASPTEELWERAEDMLDGTKPAMVLDARALLALASRAVAGDPNLRQARPYLERLDVLAAGAGTEGDELRSRLAVGVGGWRSWSTDLPDRWIPWPCSTDVFPRTPAPEVMKPATDISDPRVVKALNHPLRVQILRAIEVERASPVELSRRLDAPLGVVSYHVRVLADLGLIKLVKRTPRRGAVEHHYEAKAPVLLDDNVWKQLPKAARRARNAPLLEEAAAVIERGARAGSFDAESAHLSLAAGMLDEKGEAELAAELAKMGDRVQKIFDASAKRMGTPTDGAAPAETSVVMMAFDSSVVPAPKKRAGAKK